MELVISAVEHAEKPTVLFGFHSPEFSQAVYLTVDVNPLECFKVAEDMSEGFLKACGEAVKMWRANHAESAGEAFEGSGDAQGSDGSPT